jgi:basic membrane protein A
VLLRLFGTLRVDADGRTVDLGSPKQRATLAILALHCGRTVSTDSLIDAMWGEAPPRTAAHSVQIYASGLRKALASVPALRIETTRPGYRLDAPDGSVDVVEFDRLVELGTESRDAAALEAAMSLWDAEPLQEFRHDHWARPHIERLAERRAHAAIELAAGALDDDPRTALRWAQVALAGAPLGERGCELVMLSQYRLGHHADALRTYEDFRQRLGAERGLVPTPSLARRHEQVLMHDRELDALPVVGVGGAGSNRRRRWIAIGATLGALGLAGGIAIAAAGGGSESKPIRAVLLNNELVSQIRLQAQAGFEDGLQAVGGTGSAIDVEQRDAVKIALDAEPDLVVAPAVEFDIAAAAAAHPDTHFVTVDHVVNSPNVTSVIVNSHEASYLAGVAAALKTTSGTVGFIGGVDEELIWQFAGGYIAGVHATDPAIDVLVEYLAEPPEYAAGYEEPASGEAAARRMYTAGADVVFAAAGTSGLGVFEAAADMTSETGQYRWAIGVDADQYNAVQLLPLTVDEGRWRPHILTSVLRPTDVTIRNAVIAFADGDLASGTQFAGLAEGAVGLSYSGGFLDAHRERLERLREEIVAGQIEVPCRPVDRVGRSSPGRPHPCE